MTQEIGSQPRLGSGVLPANKSVCKVFEPSPETDPRIEGAATRRYEGPLSIGDNPMTKVEYDGDNPLRLANEIEAALAKYGLGSDHRMCKAIHFFEGELRLIAECLRCAGPQKVAKPPFLFCPNPLRPRASPPVLPDSCS